MKSPLSLAVAARLRTRDLSRSLLQLRHYKASLSLHNLLPGHQSREFAELVHFVAQVRIPQPGLHHQPIS